MNTVAPAEQPKESVENRRPSTFGNFKMVEQPEKVAHEDQDPTAIFKSCYNDVVSKTAQYINPSIFVNQEKPSEFEQKIPDKLKLMNKRNSVFHKIDIADL